MVQSRQEKMVEDRHLHIRQLSKVSLTQKSSKPDQGWKECSRSPLLQLGCGSRAVSREGTWRRCVDDDDDVTRSQLTLYNGKALAKSREGATWGSHRMSKRRWSLSLRPSKGPQLSSAEAKAPHCFPC